MDDATVRTYQTRAEAWVAQRQPHELDAARDFGASVPPGWRADLGCGPGWHAHALGEPVLALDAAPAMLSHLRRHAPRAFAVAGDIEALPLRTGALRGTWARHCYQHIPAERLPLALAELHRCTQPGGRIDLRVLAHRSDPGWQDPFGDRLFSTWSPAALTAVVHGAGFEVERCELLDREWVGVVARRARSLADVVGPGMRLLVCGLNPSAYAADAGVAFARPGNRFWPAALAAGLVSTDRDPLAALRDHGVGFTDLVKRATPRAEALQASEYVAGFARVRRLCEWLVPGVLCFAGLTGYRQAGDRRAQAGWQPSIGATAVYLMPNPSGLNAHATEAVLTDHLRTAMAGPPRRP